MILLGSNTYDDASKAYFTRASGLGNDEKHDLDNLIKALKSNQLWDEIDVLCVASASEANSLLNLKQNAYNASVVGSPVFTSDEGWTIAATDYIDSNFIPVASSTLFDDQDNCMGLYNRATPSVTGKFMGYIDPPVCFIHGYTSALLAYSQSYGTSRGGLIKKTFCVSLNGTTATVRTYTGTTSISGGTPAVWDPFTDSFYIGAANDTGSPVEVMTDAQIAAWFFGSAALGEGFTGKDKITTILQDYFTARGTAA